MIYPRRTHKHLELVEILGNPNEEERAAIALAIEKAAEGERTTGSSALWPLASGPRPASVGLVDYREDVSNEDAWRLSTLAARETQTPTTWA